MCSVKSKGAPYRVPRASKAGRRNIFRGAFELGAMEETMLFSLKGSFTGFFRPRHSLIFHCRQPATHPVAQQLSHHLKDGVSRASQAPLAPSIEVREAKSP